MNTRPFLLLWALLVIAIVSGLLAGCDTAQPMSGMMGQPLQKESKVIAKGSGLTHYLRVTNHKADRTDADLLRVRIGILNRDDDDMWCDIQVVFYDGDGFELEKTNYQPLFLPNQQVAYYETVSLSPQAYDYSILLRELRKNETTD